MAGPDTRREQAAREQAEDGSAPGLRGAEHRQVERRAAPRAAVVFETIRREGVDELARPTSALAWSGLAAGLSMGFSLVTEGLLRAGLPDTPWRPLVSRFGYSIGFLIVVLGRQQLFTENTLTPILPLLARRNLTTLLQVLRLWGVVLLANLIGALAFAWAIGRTNVFAPEVQRAFAGISAEALRGDVATTFLRAIFAGWLIALMVWLLPFAETARVGVIVIITYVVGLGGFSHIIVGSVETFYAVVTGAATWSRVLGGFVLPTLAGNILGGVALVAVLNYAQVVSGGAADA